MHVVARQLQRRRIAQPHDGGLGRAAHQGEAELAVDQAGRGLGVRVRVDAGRDAQHHRLPHAAIRRHPLQQREFVLVIDDDPPHPASTASASSVALLLLPWNAIRFGREAARPRDVQLAARDDVHAHALLGQQGGQAGVQEGLGGVEHARARQARLELAAVFAADLADRGFVVEIQRRAVVAAELHDVAARHPQVAGVVDRGRDREQAPHTRGKRLRGSLAHGGCSASSRRPGPPCDATRRPGGRSGHRCRIPAAPRSRRGGRRLQSTGVYRRGASRALIVNSRSTHPLTTPTQSSSRLRRTPARRPRTQARRGARP